MFSKTQAPLTRCLYAEALEGRTLLAGDVALVSSVETATTVFDGLSVRAQFDDFEGEVRSGDAFDFGTTDWGEYPSLKLTIENTQSERIELDRVRRPEGFHILDLPSSEFEPGGSDDVHIVYVSSSPSSSGIFSFDVHHGGASSRWELQISANRPLSAASFSTQGTPLSSGDLLDFGSADFRTESELTITMENHGEFQLSMYNVKVDGPFTVVGDDLRIVLPGASEEIQLQMVTDGPGAKQGTFSFATNDLGSQLVSFELAGFVTDNGLGPGDLNFDGATDSADIELLQAAVRGQSEDLSLDLNADQAVTGQDIDYLVDVIMGAQRGDVDLDGHVGFADFLVLSDNFGSSDAYWSGGNFDDDDNVSFADFLALADSFGGI